MNDTPQLAVLGIGLGRTGTASLKLALEQLGFGPCHHMLELFSRPADSARWQARARGEPVGDGLRHDDGVRDGLKRRCPTKVST